VSRSRRITYQQANALGKLLGTNDDDVPVSGLQIEVETTSEGACDAKRATMLRHGSDLNHGSQNMAKQNEPHRTCQVKAK